MSNWHSNEGSVEPIKPFGIVIAQDWSDFCAIFDIIQQYEVELFVELGVFKGGLAACMALRCLFQEGFSYMGVDLPENPYLSSARVISILDISLGGAAILFRDVFDTQTVNMVENRVRRSGRTIIFCDNGNKPREVQLYHSACKSGDILMVHDYGTEVLFKDVEFLYDSPDWEHPERPPSRNITYFVRK